MTHLCREAFAAWLPFWGVPFSYAVAITYVLTDTADKGTKAFRNSHGELSANEKLHPEVNISRQASEADIYLNHPFHLFQWDNDPLNECTGSLIDSL